jgi:drug/metabolite transporter (DMT)-like permease
VAFFGLTIEYPGWYILFYIPKGVRLLKTYTLKGPVVILVSSLLYAVMGVLIKLASATLPTIEIAFARFLFGVLTMLVLARTGFISLSSDRKSLLIVRGVFGGAAILLFYLAMSGGTLTNATVLNNTYPLFATLFAAFFLREKLRPSVTVPLGAAVAGMGMMAHPDLGNINFFDLLALLSGILGGMAIVVIRELRKTETAWVVFFYLSMFGTAFSGIVALPQLVVPSLSAGIFMFSAAAIGTVAQLMSTWAFKYSTATVGSVLSMSTAVFATIFGVTLLGEKLTLGEGIGAILIVLASTLMAAGYGIVKEGTKAGSA